LVVEAERQATLCPVNDPFSLSDPVGSNNSEGNEACI
jgi:hypothetical protein